MKTKKCFFQICNYCSPLFINASTSNRFSKYKLKYGAILLILVVAGSYSNKMYGNSSENPPLTQDAVIASDSILRQCTVEGSEIVDDIYPIERVVVSPPVERKDKIFKVAEIQPQFPGGGAELMKYLSTNLKYPEDAKKQSIEGRVIVQFVINKTGKIINTKILQSLHPSCDKEVIRLIESMPDWVPGKQNGNPVPVYYTLPIRFKLEKSE